MKYTMLLVLCICTGLKLHSSNYREYSPEYPLSLAEIMHHHSPYNNPTPFYTSTLSHAEDFYRGRHHLPQSIKFMICTNALSLSNQEYVQKLNTILIKYPQTHVIFDIPLMHPNYFTPLAKATIPSSLKHLHILCTQGNATNLVPPFLLRLRAMQENLETLEIYLPKVDEVSRTYFTYDMKMKEENRIDPTNEECKNYPVWVFSRQQSTHGQSTCSGFSRAQ